MHLQRRSFLPITLVALVLTSGCSPDGTDVLSAGASSTASPAEDQALAAAREACTTYASAQLWELNSVYSEGDYLGEEVMPAPDATEKVALIRERVAVARADGRFEALGQAADLLDWWGDRSEVAGVQEQMYNACQLVPD